MRITESLVREAYKKANVNPGRGTFVFEVKDKEYICISEALFRYFDITHNVESDSYEAIDTLSRRMKLSKEYLWGVIYGWDNSKISSRKLSYCRGYSLGVKLRKIFKPRIYNSKELDKWAENLSYKGGIEFLEDAFGFVK
jgi:hypothetical protein